MRLQIKDFRKIFFGRGDVTDVEGKREIGVHYLGGMYFFSIRADYARKMRTKNARDGIKHN
ncbi:MAG: hypothetical protein Q6373_002200 [Candidatus Sigynarchaeota archaeon]